MIRKILLSAAMMAILAGCNKISDSDRREASSSIQGALQNIDVCRFDEDFEFPAILVGRKFAGKNLARFDALVSAGILHEQVQVLSVPKEAPKHLYHYTKRHQIELKVFDLTDVGRSFYRKSEQGGYFCYGKPELVEIDSITPAAASATEMKKNVVTVSFTYRVVMTPDWVRNELVRVVFPKIERETEPNEPQIAKETLIANQQFARNKEGALVPSAGGVLSERIW